MVEGAIHGRSPTMASTSGAILLFMSLLPSTISIFGAAVDAKYCFYQTKIDKKMQAGRVCIQSLCSSDNLQKNLQPALIKIVRVLINVMS